MERLTSLEEYKSILREGRIRSRGGYNNMYLDITSIKRYLSLGRIYYELNDVGVMLFTDEEQYYRMYLQCSPHSVNCISAQDKPILIRNIYKAAGKSDILDQMENVLKKQGFTLYDQSVQILAQPLAMEDIIHKKYDMAMSFLKRAQINIIYANAAHLDEIISLRNAEPELKPYHFFYLTREEMLEDLENG